MKMGDLREIFDISEKVQNEAVKISKLDGEALVATLGASVVVGFIGGALWWLPAAMAGSLGIYRFVTYCVDNNPSLQKIRNQKTDVKVSNLEIIHKSSLPGSIKETLFQNELNSIQQEVPHIKRIT